MNQPDQTAGSHGHFEGWFFSAHPSPATPPPPPRGEAPGPAPLGSCSGRPRVVLPPLGLQTPHAPSLCRLQRSALELLTQPPSCVAPSPPGGATATHTPTTRPQLRPASPLPSRLPSCRPGQTWTLTAKLPPPERSLSSDGPASWASPNPQPASPASAGPHCPPRTPGLGRAPGRLPKRASDQHRSWP